MYYVAINSYANSTSNGFLNTWRVYRCRNRAEQKKLLTVGLPLPDRCFIDHEGRQTPEYSTNGIRLATQAEIRKAKKNEEIYPAVEIDGY